MNGKDGAGEKEIGERLHAGVSDAQVPKCGFKHHPCLIIPSNLSKLHHSAQHSRLIKFNGEEIAMCAFSVELVDFDKLSDAQKKTLLKSYQKKKKAVEAQLKDANASLKGINRAIKLIEKKSKRRK